MAIWNERIRSKRLEKGITLAQIADKLGVTEATAQRYESGNIKSVPYEHMCAYAQLLGCSPAYLMGWAGNEGDSLIDYFDETLEDIVKFIEKCGYDVLETKSSKDDTIIIKNKNREIIMTTTQGDLVGRYEKLKMDNIPKTIENILNIKPETFFPENIRAAARGMIDLSPEDQKSAIDMINYLSQKGKEAKEN